MKSKLTVVLIGAVLLSSLGSPLLAGTAEDVNLEEHYGIVELRSGQVELRSGQANQLILNLIHM